uniref:Uncharacterized protein n=1 Tax=Anguilla anguilla TaxID=7936 RepID=A0A0E9V552_ANGAN
MLPAPGCFL